eukprot:CAMPEP_0198724570 /NCGR_PEP_ID=MMETSP1475-20131203/2031_1 /TAXON_ID= ORGANISM="Unidentified sp., Strain CCMP1999" /NCGR_SAMPLE_ID=MMETSP1475 /ASSEMBLY_ACC=CAM_ASM_001111 /LENGTH=274 /DNA_ID=CAMNT_0044486135 /DNA_START=335 /DNA_END=1160 /DNA_ORIENTATION=+
MDLSRLVTSGGRGRSLSADVLENDTFGRIRPGSLLRAPLSLVPAKINKQERELENNACELENNACELENNACELLFNRRELSQRADGPDVAERADELRRFEGFTAQHSSEERGGLAHNSEGVTDDAEVSPRNSAIYTTGEEEEVGLLKEKLSLPAMEDCGTGRAETFRSVELDPSTERPFYCKRCLSAFSSKSNLQVHNGQYTTVNGHMYVSSAITDLERRATVIGTSGWSTETRELTNVPTATRRLAHEAAFEDTVEKFMERYQQPHEVSEHN